MTTTALEEVAWDLEPLVDGDGPEGADRLLDEATERAERFAAAHAGKVAELDGPGAGRRDGRARGDLRSRRPRRQLRDAALLGRHRRSGQRRAAPAGAGARDGDRDDAAVLRARVGGAARRARRGAPGGRRARQGAPPPAHRAPLPPAPPQRARGEDHGREVGDAAATRGCGCSASSRARSRSTSPARRRRSRSTSRSRGWSPPTARCGAPPPRRSRPRSRPGLRTRAYIFNTLAHDKAVDDRLRSFPTWISSRNLANEASDESVQALVEAVRANYDLPQRWYRLKATAAGHRPARRLRPDGGGRRRGRRRSSGPRRPISSSTRSTSSRPKLAGVARRFFDEHWIDAPVRPGKRGGAFCAYTVPSAHPT